MPSGFSRHARASAGAPNRLSAATGHFIAFAVVLAVLALGASRPCSAQVTHAPESVEIMPPSDPDDLQGWLTYRTAHALAALPEQAALFHRRGVEAARKQDFDAAVRLWRGAEELDPTALAPRLTLAAHFMTRDPSQGLIEIARLVSLARTSFRLQHHLVSAAISYAIMTLFLSTLVVALLLCFRHRDRLRHIYEEMLQGRIPGRRARVWSWVLFLLPWCMGLGLAIPAVVTLGLMWSYLRKSERAVLVGLAGLLVASPTLMNLMDDLSLPFRTNEAPFYSTIGVDHEEYSPARIAELDALRQQDPENPFLAFASGWLAQRGQQWEEAIAAYGTAENRWSREPRIANNLGNVEFLRGNPAVAELRYKRAIQLDPTWAAPHYNLGQLYTQRFRYAEASEEIAQATALDFDLVRTLQAKSAALRAPALAEEWLSPGIQWQAVFAHRPQTDRGPMLPPWWRLLIECRGTAVSVWTLLMLILGVALGLVLHNRLPARACSNCGAVICRRCATRRREQALCAKCAEVAESASTTEFGRMLLTKRGREIRQVTSRIRHVVAALVPGYGALALDRVITGWSLMTLAIVSALCALSAGSLFPYEPRLASTGGNPFASAPLAGLFLAYGLSILAYLTAAARAETAATEAARPARPVAPRVKRAA